MRLLVSIGDHRKKSSSRENERGKNLPETSGFDDLETREGREIVEFGGRGKIFAARVSRDSALAGGPHLTAAGRVSIHGGRASKTREFEVANPSATPSRGRGPTRGVWGAKYVRYEASARVARRRMSQERVLGLEIFLCELPKVTFSSPRKFERLLQKQNLPDVDDLEREGQSARGSFMDFGNSEQIRTKSSKTHGQTGPPAPKRVSPGHNSAMCPEKKMHNFFDANRFLLL